MLYVYGDFTCHLVTANKLFFFLNHKCIAMANGLSYFSAGDLGGSAERTTKSQRGNYWRLDYTLKKTLILLQYQLLCVLTVCFSLLSQPLFRSFRREAHSSAERQV